MTRQAASSRWRQCPGCGRERRLAVGGTVMREHNRWDPATWSMVRCEGSGREPAPQPARDSAGNHLVRGAV